MADKGGGRWTVDAVAFIIIQLAQQIFLRARLFYEFIAGAARERRQVALASATRARDTCKLPSIIHPNFYSLARPTVPRQYINVFIFFDNVIFSSTSGRLWVNRERVSGVPFVVFHSKKG